MGSDNQEISIPVLEERFAGLQRWLDERFQRLDDRLGAMAGERCELDARLEKLEERVREDHEGRLVRLERLAWLMAGTAAMLSPVAVWAVIEIIKALAGKGGP